MAIEKVFAIKAAPEKVWSALRADLEAGDATRFTVEASTWPTAFQIRVDLGGMPVLLSYRIEPSADGSEVAATIVPLSFRYKVFQAVSFGHLRRNYEMLLVLGLSNLKSAVEADAQPGVVGPVEPQA